MNINASNSLNRDNNSLDKSNKNQTSPNFKGLLDIPGYAMNTIEKGGFATSFIIQDTLGMTVPRTGEGLIRGIDKDRVNATWNVIKAKLTFQEPSDEDKEKCLKLKELNFKEGLEVGIREGLSGPVMMFTPMLVLFLGKKFVGKSTFTNSGLIKRLGKKFTQTVENSGVDKKAQEIKTEFYKTTVRDMVKSTTTPELGKDAESFVEKVTEKLNELDRYDAKIANSSGKFKKRYKKAKERANARLVQAFNDYHKTNSSDLTMLNRVKLDEGVFGTEKTLDGIRNYAHDALNGKKAEELFNAADNQAERVSYSQHLKSNSLVKRQLVNVAAALSTIGSLSIVPALYKLVNPVPPGALGDPTKEAAEPKPGTEPKVSENVAKPTANKNHITTEQNNNKKGSQVNFTGKLDTIARHFEFNGSHFTPALMSTLAVGGLMTPRCLTAVKRAPEDPVTKKKDYSEVPEILTRDITSTGAVTFGVPMLSKVLISTYEDSTGFVLQNKPKTEMSMFKKVLDKLNPFSAYSYFEINDLDQIYGNLDTTEKLENMSRFVDDNGGNIAKVLKTEKGTKSVFDKYGLDIKALAKQSDKKGANTTILEKLAQNKDFANELVESLAPKKKGGANSLLNRARSLNSYVSFASTVLFIPIFLGLILPKMVYGMTARRQRKAAEERAKYEQQNSVQPQQTFDYSKLNNIATSTTFAQMKH